MNICDYEDNKHSLTQPTTDFSQDAGCCKVSLEQAFRGPLVHSLPAGHSVEDRESRSGSLLVTLILIPA